MNKARRKNNKTGTAKRLVRESLILSSTAYLSSRFVRLFETGALSFLLSSVGRTENFIHDTISAPAEKKLGLRKRITKPFRSKAASVTRKNAVMRFADAIRIMLLNSSLRTAGVFLLTFGMYSAAIFVLKRYVNLTLGSMSPDDFSVAAISVVAGLLLTFFGEKSILRSLGEGRVTGYLLSECLGINEASLYTETESKRPPSYAGIMLLAGSICGIATVYFTPVKVLTLLAAVIVVITVFNIPEFGLLLAALIFTFVPVETSASILAITIASYLLKCLRLKRNMHFGTADVAVLIFILLSFIGVKADGISAFCFMAAYFLVKNLVCSEKLIFQTISALRIGACMGMALYLLGNFAEYITISSLHNAVVAITAFSIDTDFLGLIVASMLPFALLAFAESGRKKGAMLQLALSAACVIITDSYGIYILTLVSFFVYIAVAHKAPFGALLGALIVFPPVMLYASEFTLAAESGKLAVASGFFAQMATSGGVIMPVLFAAVALLTAQRLFGCMRICGSRSNQVKLCGAVAASAIILLVCAATQNLYDDIRLTAWIWIVFGLGGSVYGVYSRTNINAESEELK